MGAPKTQISPIPPESYGERFIKFISGLAMTREEQERAAHSSEQMDGSTSHHTNQRLSFNLCRKSTDRVIERAEKQARMSEEHGATEDERKDRTLSAKRSGSADRTNGVAGTTLPVVEEDREASSREESLHNEKQATLTSQIDRPNGAQVENALERPEGKRENSVHDGQAVAILQSPIAIPEPTHEDSLDEIKSIRNRDGDKPPPTPEKDFKYQSLPTLPTLPPLKFVATPRVASPAPLGSEED